LGVEPKKVFDADLELIFDVLVDLVVSTNFFRNSVKLLDIIVLVAQFEHLVYERSKLEGVLIFGWKISDLQDIAVLVLQKALVDSVGLG
jgi:hypothetical protein